MMCLQQKQIYIIYVLFYTKCYMDTLLIDDQILNNLNNKESIDSHLEKKL